ncbi:50S ribosomal protein L29 [Candidatus Heimdallarchaeota archaeon B3_Heim]|nr:MAG: 50S ribosomal protein L29 [Candidatus Heimdallarchaeota archaeon B3_Heim]
MAILRKAKIREMNAKEREKKLQELKTELLTLRSKAQTGAIESAGRVRELRRTIARIYTISKEEGQPL